MNHYAVLAMAILLFVCENPTVKMTQLDKYAFDFLKLNIVSGVFFFVTVCSIDIPKYTFA